MLKFAEWPKIPVITSKEPLNENKLVAGDLRANQDKTNADMIQFIKRWN